MSAVPSTLRTRLARRSATTAPLVLVACLAASGVASGSASGAPAARGTCSTSALAFSEKVEPVIEAVTDGRPGRVQPAAARAQSWWAANRAGFPNASAVDSAMSELKVQAVAHRAPLAARAALLASTAALDGCMEPPTVAANMMRIDLAGMAGWLRAHGVNVPFPRNVEKAALAICERLRASGHAALADRLAKEVAATLVIPVRVNGDVHAANALLARVDEAELAVR